MKKKKLTQLEDIKEARAYLARVNAVGRSLRTAVVEEKQGSGYWRDLAVIKFTREGVITCDNPLYLPTKDEQAAIEEAFGLVEWPELKLLTKFPRNLPKEIKDADPENVFEFRDEQNRIIMVQLRLKMDNERGKAYTPWTYWDDDEWRMQEPDGLLPIWGVDHLGSHSTVFLHEGAKAARAIHRMVTDSSPAGIERMREHPWGKELAAGAHLGWIGGALSPHRTAWGALKKLGVSLAYVIADNDAEGTGAVPAIAKRLGVKTFHVQFTNEWKAAFDLADIWPEEMFGEFDVIDAKTGEAVVDKKTGEVRRKRHYIGPSFRACLHPATWATTQYRAKPKEGQKGQPPLITNMRECFVQQWRFAEEVNVWVHTEFPEILREEAIFNKLVRPYSDVKDTAALLQKEYSGRTTKLCYRPDTAERIVTSGGTSAINLFVPSEIHSVPGNVKPWLDFLEYLVPDEKHRATVQRWCATLIARPDVRIGWGLLMVGTQGIGKTMLGEAVLAPLVGLHNTSFPNETEIVDSQFNEWLMNKRLAVVNEIYHGHSWKAYNKLKSVITDKHCDINPKFGRKYRIECHMHVFANSNHEQSMRMEKDDRRWFYPELTTEKWPREKFGDFLAWLRSGGLQVIRHWAETFEGHIEMGEMPPMTERKKELVSESLSEAQKEVMDLARAMQLNADGEPSPLARGLTMIEVREWVHKSLRRDKLFESDHSLRKAMIGEGAIVWPDRLTVGGRWQYILVNPALKAATDAIEDPREKAAEVRKALMKAADILPPRSL